ncbi:MAG TPA: NAD-dependent epimerase/dehydratase family protein [Solirubrobacteraceae bacterium]|nr:NAD-dependent epimerase/dehydratase family protein [Solirubrobacteraceae bacterium]
MRILVTGASGFVGSLLVPRLRAEGHRVLAFGREPARVSASLARTSASARRAGELRTGAEVEIVRGDVLTGEGLARALADVEVAYYLVHSMERSRDPHSPSSPFPERESVAAERFAEHAVRAGVRRIVYLGGVTPSPRPSAEREGRSEPASVRVSRHLASREHVERVLLAAVPDSLALRASIVIGARSRSFRLLVHLVERLPVLTLPAWHTLRTQPLDERDVVEMLLACADARLPRRSLDVGGPDVLTYGEMLETIAELMLLARPKISLGVNLTPFTARVAAAIAGEDPELVVALMEGLQGDLLPAADDAAELLGVRLHSFSSAVEHALAEWDRHEPLAAR